jgi:hypothetical protein
LKFEGKSKFRLPKIQKKLYSVQIQLPGTFLRPEASLALAQLSFRVVLAPVNEDFRKSGMTEAELDSFLQDSLAKDRSERADLFVQKLAAIVVVLSGLTSGEEVVALEGSNLLLGEKIMSFAFHG